MVIVNLTRVRSQRNQTSDNNETKVNALYGKQEFSILPFIFPIFIFYVIKKETVFHYIRFHKLYQNFLDMNNIMMAMKSI